MPDFGRLCDSGSRALHMVGHLLGGDGHRVPRDRGLGNQPALIESEKAVIRGLEDSRRLGVPRLVYLDVHPRAGFAQQPGAAAKNLDLHALDVDLDHARFTRVLQESVEADANHVLTLADAAAGRAAVTDEVRGAAALSDVELDNARSAGERHGENLGGGSRRAHSRRTTEEVYQPRVCLDGPDLTRGPARWADANAKIPRLEPTSQTRSPRRTRADAACNRS